MKISLVKVASVFFVTLASLGCAGSLSLAMESTPQQSAGTVEQSATVKQSAATLEQSAAAVSQPTPVESPKAVAPQKPKPEFKASVLYGILERTNYEGWEPAELRQYQVADGHLYATDPVAIEASENANLTLPIFGNDLLPLQEFRCRVIVQKRFKRGNRYITIRAFQFENAMGANAGYDLLRKGSTTVVKLGHGSSDDGDSISFWQSNFLFIISGTSLDDDESKGVIGVFAKKLSGNVSLHNPPPSILLKLPIVDRVRGSEKIVMGPVSAGRAIQAPELAALQIEKSLGAAVADYQVFIPVRERLRLLYVDYGDPQIAQTAFDGFITKLDQLHSPEKGYPQDGRVLFRTAKAYLYCQLRPGGKLLLITGARKAKSPALLASQVVER